MGLTKFWKHGSRQGDVEVVCCGFGDAGMGTLRVQGKSELETVMRRNRLVATPYYMECPSIGAMQKDIFFGERLYRLNEDRLARFYAGLLAGKKQAKIICASGGGSHAAAIRSVRLAKGLVRHLDLRVFYSENAFCNFSQDGERNYLNTTGGMAMLKQELVESPEVGMELFTIPRECHGNYSPLDVEVLNIDHVIGLSGRILCGLDPEDWLKDPEFRFRTYSFSSVPLLDDVGFIGHKVVDQVPRLKPLFAPELFKRVEAKAIGTPIIILCGPESVLKQAQDFLTLGHGFSYGMSLEERDVFDRKEEDSLPFQKIVVLPLDSPKVYIVGIHPISQDWWLGVLSDREVTFHELLRKAKDRTVNSSRIEILRRMIAQAGYTVEDFCWE